MKTTSKTFIVTSALRLKLALLLALAFALALPAMTRAATFTWDADGTATTTVGGTGTWDTSSALWRAGGEFGVLGAWANAPTDSTATFVGTAGTVTLGGSISANKLLFNTNSYILSGAQTLTLNGTTPTISLANGATTTIGNNTATILDGSAGLTKLGSGTLTLNGSAVNAFTGGLNPNAGTLALDFANLVTPTDLINNGNALTLAGGRMTVTGKSSGTTSQTFASTTVNAGGGSILVNPFGGTSTTVVLNGLTSSAAGGSLLVGTAASSGAGTVAFTTTTAKDSQNIYGGRVVFTSDGGSAVDWATTASGSSPYTLSALSSGSYTDLPLTGGSSTVNYKMTAAKTLSGSVAANTVKLENSSGDLSINTRLLTVNSGGILVTGGTARSITGTSGATRLTAGAGSSYDLVVHNYLTTATALTLTISAVIGDNGANPVSFTLAGPAQNVMLFSGVNTFTGPTYINAGRLQITAANQLGGTSGVYVKNGGQLFLNGTFTFAKNIEISGYGRLDGGLLGGANPFNQFGAIRISTSDDLSGTITLADNARIGKHAGSAATISGQITGGYGVDFYGTSSANSMATTITLSSTANNYTGDTSITHQDYNVAIPWTGGSMILKLGASGVLPDGAGKGNIVFNGADANHLTILELNGNSETVNGLWNATAAGAIIRNNHASTASTLTVGAGDTTSSFSGTIVNGGAAALALNKIGTGTLTLNNTETYTGNTTISGGTLVLGSSGSLNSSANILITNGATFDVIALGAYTLSGSTTLRASGTNGSPAKIKAGTSIDLGSQAVTLDFNPASTTGDLTSPALAIVQGNLTLNGQISINIGGGTPLGIGTYTIISNLSGTISGSPSFVTSGPGVNGMAANTTVSLDLSTPGQLNLVVQASPTLITLTRTVGGSPSTYGNTLNFHAVLSPDPGDGTVVTFLTNSVPFGTATTTGGIADLTTTNLAYSGGSPYIVTATATGYSSGLLSGGQQVNQYGLTITGAAAQDKFADGTTAAVITGGTLSSTVNGDLITANTGTFAQTNAGRGIAVTVTLSGAEAGNYSLTQPTPGLTANIYASPTWTNTLGGLWDTAGNWFSSTIADGSGVTADFSQLDIAADTTVSLNSPRTIGNLIFADTNTNSAAGWVLNNDANPANTLTLAGTTPIITVSNLAAGKSVTISAEVDGSAGLIKAGAGTLVLSGSNTISGALTVNAGALQITGGSAVSSANSVTLANAGVFDVETNVTVAYLTTATTSTNTQTKLASGAILTTVSSANYYGQITGLGGITYDGPTNGTWGIYNPSNTYSGITTINSGRIELLTSTNALSPNTTVVVNGNASGGGQFFDSMANDVISNNFTISGVGWPDASGVTRFGAIRIASGTLLGGTITLAGDSRIGVYNGASATVAGKITGPFAISFFAADGGNNNRTVFTLANSANDYTGNATLENVDYGTARTNGSTTIKLGASEVIPNGSGKGILVFNGADTNHLTILELNGFSETINGLSDAASAGAVVQNTTTGTSILTIGDDDTTSSFDGAITDGGAGSGKYLALTKIGSGTLTLAANNYQGKTTVNGGTLSLAQPTLSTNSTVSITNGAVLQLAFAGGQTNTVTALVLNGTNQPAGVYDSTTPGGYLAGSTGKLLVVPMVTINPNPPVLQVSYGAGSLTLAWPTNQGWILQTNSVGLTAINAWFNYPPDGLVNATNVTITVDPTKANVFYRMLKP